MNSKYYQFMQGFYLKRQDFFLGKLLKFGETGKIKLLRLARKNAGKWSRPVHETWQVKSKPKTLSSPLLHSPTPNVAQFLEKLNYYTTLNAKHLHKEGLEASWWQIILYPTGKFLHNYLLKLGFLDGTHGFLQAIFMSLHSFLTRGKLWLLQNSKK